MRFLPEFNKVILSGKLTTRDSIPVKQECLFISVNDTVANLQYSYTNNKGEFTFSLNDY
ncbi:MAG: hypothetical protein HC905_03570 [Bacteroidales bacterium]|nr:hypothetical protein [Bacteroidales bacterium]